uniref:Uncharacterized protein n=1 Tax=Rhizophora mucronata TaxID=61149 RepID=A0A2P2PH22_RHIMU
MLFSHYFITCTYLFILVKFWSIGVLVSFLFLAGFLFLCRLKLPRLPNNVF